MDKNIEKGKKGISPVLLILLLILTAIVFTGIGIVVSKYLMPGNEQVNIVQDDGDDGMKKYVSDKYGFNFTYPDTWQVTENGSEPTHRGSIKVTKDDYSISFIIMTYPGMQDDYGWGAEACIYSDSIVNLDDYLAVGYVQYDDYEQIDNGFGSFRRSQIEDSGVWIICSSLIDNLDNIYGTNSFLPIDSGKAQDERPLTGFIEYHTPTIDVSEEIMKEMDMILQSATMNF